MPSSNATTDLGTVISNLLKDETIHDATTALMDAAEALAAKQDKPVDGLAVLQYLRDTLKEQCNDTSNELIAAVNGEAGQYDNYTVIDQSGRASVDMKRLASEYPDVYNEVVKWGAGFKIIRIKSAHKKAILGLDNVDENGESE